MKKVFVLAAIILICSISIMAYNDVTDNGDGTFTRNIGNGTITYNTWIDNGDGTFTANLINEDGNINYQTLKQESDGSFTHLIWGLRMVSKEFEKQDVYFKNLVYDLGNPSTLNDSISVEMVNNGSKNINLNDYGIEFSGIKSYFIPFENNETLKPGETYYFNYDITSTKLFEPIEQCGLEREVILEPKGNIPFEGAGSVVVVNGHTGITLTPVRLQCIGEISEGYAFVNKFDCRGYRQCIQNEADGKLMQKSHFRMLIDQIKIIIGMFLHEV